jgi:hypothetical protein
MKPTQKSSTRGGSARQVHHKHIVETHEQVSNYRWLRIES